MIAARPLPVIRPILAHISCIAVIKGYWNITSHNIPKPNLAPAWEKVAIPDGSSSEAPVISPGPKDFRKSFGNIRFP